MSLEQHFTTHKYLHAYENEGNLKKNLKPEAKLKNRKQVRLLKYYEF